MTTSIDPKDLFSVECDADRAARLSRKDGGAHLVREGVGFTTEAASHKGAIDIDLVHWYIQHIRQGAVQIVRHLLWGVECQSTGRVPVSGYRVGLGEAVVDATEFPCSL